MPKMPGLGTMSGLNSSFTPINSSLRMDNNDFQLPSSNSLGRMSDLNRTNTKYERDYMPLDTRNITKIFDYNSDNSDEEQKELNFKFEDRFLQPYSTMIRPKEQHTIKPTSFLSDVSEMANRNMRNPLVPTQRNFDGHIEGMGNKPSLGPRNNY